MQRGEGRTMSSWVEKLPSGRYRTRYRDDDRSESNTGATHWLADA
jgi:hypothetical protein